MMELHNFENVKNVQKSHLSPKILKTFVNIKNEKKNILDQFQHGCYTSTIVTDPKQSKNVGPYFYIKSLGFLVGLTKSKSFWAAVTKYWVKDAQNSQKSSKSLDFQNIILKV